MGASCFNIIRRHLNIPFFYTMAFSYILLGTNLGNKLLHLNQAVQHLLASGLLIRAQSNIYQTKAWGNINQDDFLNVVLQVETKLNAIKLLETLLAIELQMGRVRGEEQWLPRLIDIDILYYNDEVVDHPHLIIPHPYIAKRRFTLIPLNDIDPAYIHPQLKLSNKALLEACEDIGEVIKTNLKLEFNNLTL
jgi:2-amino-4-hydroxy-6-hydroxymethyldihydropteridine diphosphokinase